MTRDDIVSQAERLLGELGHATRPDPAVLERARETLWSAVAQEMLGPPAEDQASHRRSAQQNPRAEHGQIGRAGRDPGQ